MKKRLSKLFATQLITTIVLSAFPVLMPVKAVPLPPSFYITPDQSFLSPPTTVGTTFNEYLYVATSNDTFEYQFEVDFNATQIACMSAEYSAGATSQFFAGHITTATGPTVDNVTGKISGGEILLDSDVVPATPGGALIINMTFITLIGPPIAGNVTSLISLNPANTFLLDPSLNTVTGVTYSPATYLNQWSTYVTPHLAVSPTPQLFNNLVDWNGTFFTENVTIKTSSSFLQGWQLANATTKLDYNQTLTTVTSVVFPSFWATTTWSGNNTGTLQFDVTINATGLSTITGDPNIATITFMIVDQGSVPPRAFGDADLSTLHLHDYALGSTYNLYLTMAPAVDGLVTVQCAVAEVNLPYLSVSSANLGPGPVLGQLFNVTVSLNNVNGPIQKQVAVRYRLQYDNNTLQAITATEGSYFKYFASLETGCPGTLFQNSIQNDLTFGWNVNVFQALLPNATGMYNEPLLDGSGVISIITFKVLYQPSSAGSIITPLNITDQLDTCLDNMFNQRLVTYPFDPPVNGNVTITRGEHEVAIVNVTSSRTVFCSGYLSDITVTAANLGISSETFNVTAYANRDAISSFENVALNGGEFATLTTQWNTTGFAIGNYTLNACAWPVPNETNTTDNNFTGGLVYVSIIGDITGGTPNLLDFVPDGKVDMKDIGLVARFFNANVPPAPANCDITGPTPGVPDGKVDMRDIGLVARHFGDHYP